MADDKLRSQSGLICLEDGTTRKPGDLAFNYYDRKPGTIGDDVDISGWFTFYQTDGTTALLNGERVCSLKTAVQKGWLE
jgi:hypothetical protein